MDINEKLAVVTGAGSGIGRALASRLVDAGARFVVCTDLDGAAARETADLIGAKASGAVLDVADQAAIEDLVTRVEAAHGGIDIFVSNAGYALGGGLGLDTDQWRKMMEVHLWAHLNAARAVVPGMIARGGGYLLNTASAAGLLTQLDSGPYAVSKLTGDMHLGTMFTTLGFPMNILRPSNAYGPGQALYRVIPRAVITGLTGRKLPLQGDGLAEKSFLHAYDVATAVQVVAEHGVVGEVYNCGPVATTS